MRKAKALTLIEVMVAVTIFTLLSVSLYSFLAAAFKIKRSVSINNRHDFKAKLYLDSLSRELQSSVAYYGDLRDFNATSDNLSFYTIHSEYDEAAIVKLNYFVDGHKLMRQSQSAYLEEFDGKANSVFSFDELAFAYWDSNNSTWVDNWQEKSGLPAGVRIQSSFAKKDLEYFIPLFTANKKEEQEEGDDEQES